MGAVEVAVIVLSVAAFVAMVALAINFFLEETVVYTTVELSTVQRWRQTDPPGWTTQIWLLDPLITDNVRIENVTIYAWFPQEAENATLYIRYFILENERWENGILVIYDVVGYTEMEGKWEMELENGERVSVDGPPDWAPIPEFRLVEMENTPIGRARVAEVRIPWMEKHVRVACKVLFRIPTEVLENHSYAGVRYVGPSLADSPIDSTFMYFDYTPPVPVGFSVHLCFIDVGPYGNDSREGRYMNTFHRRVVRPGEWVWSEW